MFQLIIGKTGTGKTTRVLKEAIEAARQDREVILLVPEQFSFEMERKASQALRGAQAMNLSVLSFSRLAENIFRAYGGLARKRLTDTARFVLMRLAVGEVRDTLELYQRQSQKTAFLTTMLQTIEELKSCGAYPEDLRQVSKGLEDKQLGGKLRDIIRVYEAYQAIVDRDYADPLDDIARAGELARDHGYFRGKTLFLDSFGFFSPPERRLVELMLEQGDQVTLSLCADGLTTREGGDVFHDQKETARRLLQFASSHDIPTAKPVRLEENHRTQSLALRAVEKFLSSGETAQSPENNDGIAILRCGDKYEEIHFAAAEISRLVREEKLRYRDIALVCRSIGDYETALQTIFTAYGIPLFFDRKEQVLAKPVIAVLAAALDSVRGDWKGEAILKVARSPAMGLTLEESAVLENYAYIWSVQGKGWTQPFRNDPDGMTGAAPESYEQRLAQVEEVRRKVMEPLIALKKQLERCDGKGFAMGLYSFITQIGGLEHLAEHFRDSYGEDRRELEENDQLWGMLVDMLDLFCDSIGSARYPLNTFVELFHLALSCMEIGHIPNTNDQVIAGSADRIRLSSPKVVFVVGVNEGVFPARYQPHGAFTDQERTRLIARGVELSASRYQRALQERFYLYTALTASRERLYLTYASSTLEGGQLEPSLAAVQLGGMFPGALQRASELPPEFFVVDLFTAREQYARAKGKGLPQEGTLEELLRRQGDDRYLALMERLSLDLPAGPVEPAAAKGLLRGRVAVSPTRIENFYRCPFLFFCDSMLRLRPRKRVEYSPLESGNAIHYVLEHLFRSHGGKGLSSMTDQELEGEIRRLLEEYIRSLVPDLTQLAGRFRYQLERLASVLLLLVRHVGEEFDQSLFQAAGMEVPVGPDEAVHPAPLTAQDGTPVVIRGKIDRVDLFTKGEDRYARVVDYKSGGKEFRLEEVFHGLNMQMLIYLFALCDDPRSPFGSVQPAGILYMPGKVSPAELPSSADAGQIRSQVGGTLGMKGMVLDDPDVLEAMEKELAGRYIPVKKKKGGGLTAASKVSSAGEFRRIREAVYGRITQMADALTKGEIAPFPVHSGNLNPCDYCDYGILCNNRNTPLFRDISGKGRGEEKNHG